VWIVSVTEPAGPVAEPAYDHELISGLEGLLAEGERGWLVVCEQLGVEPMICYEDLADPDRYGATLHSVLATSESIELASRSQRHLRTDELKHWTTNGSGGTKSRESTGQAGISDAMRGFSPWRLPSIRVGANRMKADCRWKSLRCCSLMASL